jgi:hypothetical protein
MENRVTEKSGYIIILTLLIVGAATALLTTIVQQSLSYQQRVRLAQDKARARMLALSSLEIAISELSTVVFADEEKKPDEKEEHKKEEQEVLEPVQKWLIKVLPSLNHWQTIEVDQEGLEGTIKLYLASEDGKFNLAAFKEKEGEKEPQSTPEAPEAKKLGASPQENPLQALDELFKKNYDTSMYEAFKRFMTDYKRMPEDPTELLRISYFAKVKDRLFTPLKKEHRGLYIMDLFTFRPQAINKVNPWLLTASAKTLLGLSEGTVTLTDQDLVKKMKPSMNWEEDWDEIFAPRYGKNFAAFDPAIQKLFSPTFEALAFSVVSYCTVGKVTQRIYAVLGLAEPDKDLSPKSGIYKVTKLYWF